VTFLEANALLDSEAFEVLESYDLEVHPSLKTRAAIAYGKPRLATGRPKDRAIDMFSEALVCGGPDFESRRHAAVCGLDVLGRLDLGATVRRAKQDPLPMSVTGALERNDAFIVYLLSNWSRLRSAMGDDFSPTFFQAGNMNDLDWWSHVADFADEHPEVRDALLALLGGVHGVQLYSELLLFLGRNRPRSALLLEHCLKVIRNEGQRTGRWIEIDTAAFLLGRDFGGEDAVLSAILQGRPFPDPSDALWAACEGWPEADIVVRAYDHLKARSHGQAIVNIATIVDMHVLCCRGTSEEVVGGVSAFVSRLDDELKYHYSAFLRPLLKRVRTDLKLLELLHERLIAPRNPSEACSIPSILNRAIGLDSDLRDWALKTVENAARTGKSSLCSAVGFDLSVGVVRTIWDVAVDLLQRAVRS
jgi:hypothetical protein